MARPVLVARGSLPRVVECAWWMTRAVAVQRRPLVALVASRGAKGDPPEPAASGRTAPQGTVYRAAFVA